MNKPVILIVEDTKLFSDFMVQLLKFEADNRRMDIEVKLCNSFDSALRAVEEFKPLIISTDMDYPEYSGRTPKKFMGVEFIEILRAEKSFSGEFFVFSGHDTSEIKERLPEFPLSKIIFRDARIMNATKLWVIAVMDSLTQIQAEKVE